MPSTTALVIIEEVARQLRALVQGTLTAADGAGANITVGNDPQFRTQRTNADAAQGFAGAEFVSTSGTPPVPNPNRIATHVWSTGVLTPAIVFTTPPGGTSTFDLFTRGITRAMLIAALNRALREYRYTDRVPLSYVDDADMEASGVGAFTSVNATPTKVAGRNGAQALRVTLSGASGYSRFPELDVDPTYGKQWLIAAEVRAGTGTGELIAWDGSNSAAITSITWTARGWGYVYLFVNLPATCELLQVRMAGQGASDVVDYDNVTVLPVGADEIYLPAYVDDRQQVRRVWRRGFQQMAEHNQWRPYFWHDIISNRASPGVSPDFAPSPYKLSIAPTVSAPIYIDVDRPYPSVSANTDTTFAPRRWIEQATLVKLLEDLASNSPAQETTSWKARLAEEQRVLVSLNAKRQEPVSINYRFSSPPNTPIMRGY